jgi:hypothetical protein
LSHMIHTCAARLDSTVAVHPSLRVPTLAGRVGSLPVAVTSSVMSRCVCACVCVCVSACVCVCACLSLYVRARCKCAAESPSPGGDVAAASPVQMWAHADLVYPTTPSGARVASAALLRVRRPTAAARALFRALHRPAPLSAAKGSPPPHLPTADDRRQGHTRPDSNSAAHPGCKGSPLARETASGARPAAPCRTATVHAHAADLPLDRIEGERSPSPAGWVQGVRLYSV